MTTMRHMFEAISDSSSYAEKYRELDGIFFRGEGLKGRGVGLGALGRGVYVTWREASAQAFADRHGAHGRIVRCKLRAGLRMLDVNSPEMQEIKGEMGFGTRDYSDDPMYAGLLAMAVMRKGYDGVSSDDSIEGLVVFDEKNVTRIEDTSVTAPQEAPSLSSAHPRKAPGTGIVHAPKECGWDPILDDYSAKNYTRTFVCKVCGKRQSQSLNRLGNNVFVCDGQKFTKVPTLQWRRQQRGESISMTTMREILEAKGGDFQELLERLEAQTKTGVTLRVLSGGMDPAQRKIASTVAAAKSAPPAVKQHADADKGRELRGIGVGIGDTEEHDGLRFHRYASALMVTDLANAGKRGKTVPEFSLYNLDYTFGDKSADELENALESIAKAKTYAQALQIAKKAVAFVHADGSRYGSSLNIEERPLRGVDVDPPSGASGSKIAIDTPHFSLSVDARGFSVDDKDDQNNLPCVMTPVRGAKQTAVKNMRAWVEANRDKIQDMTFAKLTTAMGDAGIHYHYFCRMD